MTVLAEHRADIKTTLTEADDAPAGFRAFEYVGESLAPPCAAVVPAEPYLRGPSRVDDIPFGRAVVGIDVLLISGREDAKQAAKLADELLEFAWRTLRPKFNVRTASRPGIITISGAKFIGSVLTIEQLTEEP